MQKEWITVSKASQMLNVSLSTIYRKIERREFESKEIEGVKHVLIDLASDNHSFTDVNQLLNEKDKHIQSLEKQIQSNENQMQELREEVERLHEARERADMIIAQLTQQNQLMLEDMSSRSIWKRIKLALGFTPEKI